MPEASLAISLPALDVTEQPIGQILVLRLGRGERAVVPALESAFGAELLLTPNTANGTDPRFYWLAPGEWAIVSQFRGATDIADRIGTACTGVLHHVADLMLGWNAFAIEGEGAREFIAAGCSLDLHPRAFAVGACAQTLLAQMPVLLERVAEDRFQLCVDRSFAAHMRGWLRDAAQSLAGAA